MAVIAGHLFELLERSLLTGWISRPSSGVPPPSSSEPRSAPSPPSISSPPAPCRLDIHQSAAQAEVQATLEAVPLEPEECSATLSRIVLPGPLAAAPTARACSCSHPQRENTAMEVRPPPRPPAMARSLPGRRGERPRRRGRRGDRSTSRSTVAGG